MRLLSMPYKASYLHQSDVQLSEQLRNPCLASESHTCVRTWGSMRLQGMGFADRLGVSAHDVKQCWMTSLRGLACLVLGSSEIRGRGNFRTPSTRPRPGSFRPRGVTTPAPAVDHAHPNHNIVVLQSDFSEWCYREFPVRGVRC